MLKAPAHIFENGCLEVETRRAQVQGVVVGGRQLEWWATSFSQVGAVPGFVVVWAKLDVEDAVVEGESRVDSPALSLTIRRRRGSL